MAPNFCVRKEGPREAKMEPKWSQDEAKSNAKTGPRDPRDPRAKMGPSAAKRAKTGPRRGQEGAKNGQDEAKMGPR